MNNKTGNVILINVAKPKFEIKNENSVNTTTNTLYGTFGNNFEKYVAFAEIKPTAVVIHARIITADRIIFPAYPYNTVADAEITLPPSSKYPVTEGLVAPSQANDT